MEAPVSSLKMDLLFMNPFIHIFPIFIGNKWQVVLHIFFKSPVGHKAWVFETGEIQHFSTSIWFLPALYITNPKHWLKQYKKKYEIFIFLPD